MFESSLSWDVFKENVRPESDKNQLYVFDHFYGIVRAFALQLNVLMIGVPILIPS